MDRDAQETSYMEFMRIYGLLETQVGPETIC